MKNLNASRGYFGSLSRQMKVFKTMIPQFTLLLFLNSQKSISGKTSAWELFLINWQVLTVLFSKYTLLQICFSYYTDFPLITLKSLVRLLLIMAEFLNTLNICQQSQDAHFYFLPLFQSTLKIKEVCQYFQNKLEFSVGIKLYK